MNGRIDTRVLAGLFEGLRAGILLLDPRGVVRETNPAMARMSGSSADGLVGRHAGELLSSAASALAAGGSGGEALEDVLEAGGGRGRPVRVQYIPVDGPEPGLLAVVEEAADLAEARAEIGELRRQLLAAQRLEAIGTLAGGIAHDFNNMLGGILGFASFSKSLAEPDSRLHNAISAIETTALRASALTRQLLGMVRGRRYEVRAADLNELVNDVVRLLARTFDPRVAIETDLVEPAPYVAVDDGQMQQVLLNICINARDAMPEGGRLEIRTGRFEMDGEFCRRNRGARPGRYGLVSIRDTGAGMDAETRRRIFEPFFTTKGPEAGTGLGLAMVWSIVKNHGGYLTVESAPGRGSTFTIYLPDAEAPGEAPAGDEETAVIRRGHEHLLVVDDEEVIREMVSQALEANGYRVSVCAGGAEALELFGRDPGAVDLVLLDRVMPGMDGLRVLEALRRIRPGVRVVMMTGSADGIETAGGRVETLRKPFRVSDLCRVIQAALDGGDRRSRESAGA